MADKIKPTAPPPPPKSESTSDINPADVIIAGGGAYLSGQLIEKLGKSNPLIRELGSSLKVAGSAALEFSGITSELTKKLQVFTDFAKGDFSKGLQTLTQGLQTQIKEFQNLDVELVKLGKGETSRNYIESIRKQSYEAANLGISLKELTEINKKLFTDYIDGTPLTERQKVAFEGNRKELGILVGFYEKFNITQEQSIKVFNTFNNVMGGGVREAQRFSDSLLIFAQKTGQDANKVFDQFNQNIDRFSVLGSGKALATFEKLEMMAKRTGTSVQGIITSIQKFDDIDEGFQAGGQLNRVLSFLGGSFDTFKAIQVDDEERAKMLYDAISSVSSNFQALQTTGAKRSFAKQIVESTGMELPQVLGLLNKSTNVAEDLSDIYKQPVISGEFTAQGRERAAIRVTTTEQLAKIQGQLFDLSPIIQDLSDRLQDRTLFVTKGAMEFGKFADEKYILPVATRGAAAFGEVGKQFMGDIKNLPTIFAKAVNDFDNEKRLKFEGVVEKNTTSHAKLTTELQRLNDRNDKGIEVTVTGELKGPAGQKASVVGSGSTARAMSSMPPTSTPVKGGQ